jgi:cytochrome c-type biogenesis protein
MASAIFGAAFAAGWTPCVGAVLGAILGLAASAPGSAFGLLLTYAMGFSLPFLLVGLFTDQATRLIARFGSVAVWINRLFGLFLIILGVLIFTQRLAWIANFSLLQRLVGF